MIPDEPAPAQQQPCDWCLGGPSLLLCHCDIDCGEPDCAANEARRDTAQPVPTFLAAGWLEALAKLAKPSTRRTVGPVDVSKVDSEKAIWRVVLLHQRCQCAACSAGPGRPVCESCQAFYPCPTIRAVTDATEPATEFSDGPVA